MSIIKVYLTPNEVKDVLVKSANAFVGPIPTSNARTIVAELKEDGSAILGLYSGESKPESESEM